MKYVCMIGAGAWGTAMATVLARNGYSVKLWCYDHEVAEQIEKNKINEKYLPGILLPSNIYPTTNMNQATTGVDLIFEAIPVKYLRSILEQLKNYYSQDQTVIILSKGIEKNSLLLPMQLVSDVFKMHTNTVVLAGPSFAQDVAEQKITAVDLASTNVESANKVQQALTNTYFQLSQKTDVIGVQVGAALKNVITLAIGLLNGAGYTENTKGFLFTYGLHEMAEVAHRLGGKKETLYGLSGVGDLVVTAMGDKSRNLEVGKRLGMGQKLDAIIKETGYTPEGINTVQSVYELMQRDNIDLPICKNIYQVIFEGKSIKDMLSDLVVRPLG